MVYPKKNWFYRSILHYYVKFMVRNKFHELLFNNVEVDVNKSILLLANHFSYWDGLILYCINHQLFKKNFHVMVREDTTINLYYLKFGGAFSISKMNRGMIESLDYAAQLLNDPRNLVLIFPQGKLYSNFVTDIKFEKGVQKIMKKAQGTYQLLFAATFIQYFKHKKQSVTVYLKSEVGDYADKGINELKYTYQQHYNTAKLQQTEIVI